MCRYLRPISEGPLQRLKHFPDGGITLVLRITQGSPEIPDSRDGHICVAGPRRYALIKTVTAVPLTAFIRLQPELQAYSWTPKLMIFGTG
jgi:hypothetical protein